MTERTNNPPKQTLPSPEEFFLSIPLYKAFALEGQSFFALEYFKGTIDCYCEGCGRHSVFTCKQNSYQNSDTTRNYVFVQWFTCSRVGQHKVFFIFWVHEGLLQKIGQYPSLADLATPDLQKYRKALGNERYRELTRAVGLASHGVGIGAFVYLRRIFESLIEQAHLGAKGGPEWNEDPFQAGRMDEKIAMLSAHLPPFLVENRSLYGILSKGIHTLTEDECLNAFPIVKLGIELILDEELERISRQEKVQLAKKDISVLSALIKRSESE